MSAGALRWEEVGMFNLLTGHNVAPGHIPPLDMSTVWFFYSLFKQHREHMLQVHIAYGTRYGVLKDKEHSELVDGLRSVHTYTEALQRLIDAAYQPIFDEVDRLYPDKRLEPKVIPLPRRKVPPKKRGRPKGAKDKYPRKPYKKRASATITAPDVNGDVRLQKANGDVVIRRTGGAKHEQRARTS